MKNDLVSSADGGREGRVRLATNYHISLTLTSGAFFFKIRYMRKIQFASIFFIAALIFGTTINAQNFPATEKEVKEILCTTKWKADTVIMGEKAMKAADLLGETYLEFTADGKYTLTTGNKKTVDIWKIDMVKKSVDFYEKGDKMTIITTILATRIEISEVEEDRGKGEAMKVILKPAK